MSTTTDAARTCRVGTAEVVPAFDNTTLGGASGAYVAVIAISDSDSDFRASVERALRALEFELVALTDIRVVHSERDLEDAQPSMRERWRLLGTSNPVEIGSFHTFIDGRQ